MDTKKHMQAARFIARLLDDQFSFGGIRFGIDPIIDIIPIIGDVIGVLLSLYILRIGKMMKVSRWDMVRMAMNIILDFILGFIPFIGVIFDVAYKANIKNLRILEKYSHGKFIEGEIV